MKNLLNYQTTEYDCGPVSIINGIRYLFDREEIYPDMIKFIMLYCMDTYNETGELCKHGTSSAAMNYVASWLNHFGEKRNFPIHCDFLSGSDVTLAEDGPVYAALKNGGVAVLRLYLEVPHYVLLTGIDKDRILLFDPFYEEKDDPELDKEYAEEGISFLYDRPKEANRAISIERLCRTSEGYYEMGTPVLREALLMFNTSL
jgi:hypothetical protein